VNNDWGSAVRATVKETLYHPM